MTEVQRKALVMALRHGWKYHSTFRFVLLLVRSHPDGAFAIGIRPDGTVYNRG